MLEYREWTIYLCVQEYHESNSNLEEPDLQEIDLPQGPPPHLSGLLQTDLSDLQFPVTNDDDPLGEVEIVCDDQRTESDKISKNEPNPPSENPQNSCEGKSGEIVGNACDSVDNTQSGTEQLSASNLQSDLFKQISNGVISKSDNDKLSSDIFDQNSINIVRNTSDIIKSISKYRETGDTSQGIACDIKPTNTNIVAVDTVVAVPDDDDTDVVVVGGEKGDTAPTCDTYLEFNNVVSIFYEQKEINPVLRIVIIKITIRIRIQDFKNHNPDAAGKKNKIRM